MLVPTLTVRLEADRLHPQSVPKPSVRSMIASVGSVDEKSIGVAPDFSARASRSDSSSTTNSCDAPRSTALCANIRPTGPAPDTAIVSPACSFASSTPEGLDTERKGVGRRARSSHAGLMTDDTPFQNPAHGTDDDTQLDEIETAASVDEVAEEVRDAIRHGEVEDDVSDVLEERLEEVGVHLRPETIDDIAADIENDVSH